MLNMSKQQINNNVVRCWGLCTTAVDQQGIEQGIFEIEVGEVFEDEQHAKSFARGAQIFRFGNILVVLGGTATAFLIRWSDEMYFCSSQPLRYFIFETILTKVVFEVIVRTSEKIMLSVGFMFAF